MIIIGLTGSIGMGKSTVSRQFAALGAKVANADDFVHQLMEKDDVISEISEVFPNAIIDKKIDRKILGKIVFADETKRKILEKILHPKVVELEEKFVKKQQKLGAKLVVLDIPLLFETGADARVDYAVVVSAPKDVQRRRVLARAGMSAEKFERILKTQMPDLEKKKRADFIIPTGLGKSYSFREVRRVYLSICHPLAEGVAI
jgi:dephospho-CoA kinase